MKTDKMSLKLSKENKDLVINKYPKEFGEISYQNFVEFNENIFVGLWLINLIIISGISAIRIIGFIDEGYRIDNIAGIILGIIIYVLLVKAKLKEILDGKILNAIATKVCMVIDHIDDNNFDYDEKLWYKQKVINILVMQCISIVVFIIIPILIDLFLHNIFISNIFLGIIIYGLLKCITNFTMISIIFMNFSFKDMIIIPAKAFLLIEEINPFFIKVNP